ncbi:hypothetical protein LSTR_LSTR001090 [Laodelphax striatellus]|uniref:Cytochrome c oxidase assembly factor 3 n=1 Tax=Laodelphax striatellus TaxID=195883 RepID=A0A482X170_LAOST|nr:hypothetical protein LSTR_LSTR001090 [Laodelphax striatellus]
MEQKPMEKVDLSKESGLMHKSTVDYMKIVEQQNLERVQRLKKIKARNGITGLALGAIAFGIYGYSIAAIKQETFLDDFEEPELVPKKEAL